MKKIIYLLLLMIIFIPTSVYATIDASDATPCSTNAQGKKECEAAGSDVYYVFKGELDHDNCKLYRGLKNLNGHEDDTSIYHYNAQIHWLKSDGKKYPSVCIDPALANSGGNFKCEKVDSNEYTNSIKYLFKKYDKKISQVWGYSDNVSTAVGLQLAIRAYAYQARIGVNDSETNYKKKLSNKLMEAIANRIAYGVKTGTTLAEVKDTEWDTWKDVTYDDSKNPKGKKYIDKALEIYEEAKGKGTDADADAEEAEQLPDEIFTVSKIDSDCSEKKFTYKIKSLIGSLEKDKFTFTCTSGCSNSNLDFEYSGEEGTLIVSGVEKYEIEVNYGLTTTADVLYICYKSDAELATTTNQKFLFYKDDDNTKPYKIKQNKGCTTCDCDNEAKEVDDHVSMCCKDNINSTVLQPKIETVFCDKTTTELSIEGYINKCPDKYGLSKEETGISENNNYCDVYCTEKINIAIPDSMQGNNGKYFELKPVEGHSDSYGPYFEGTRACRIVTHYTEWVADYKTKTDNAVTAFNTYQEYQAYHDMYEKLYSDKINEKEEYSGGSDGTENRILNYSGSYTNECNKPVTINTTYTKSCKFKYTAHIEESSYTPVKYEQAMKILRSTSSTTDDTMKDYKGFYITGDEDKTTAKGSEEGGTVGYYHTAWVDPTNCGKTVGVDSETYHVDAGTCTKTDGTVLNTVARDVTVYYQSVKSTSAPSDIESTLDSARSSYKQTTVNDKASAYNNIVTNELNVMENYLTECNTYFETGKGTDQNDNGSYRLYELEPSVEFVYFTTYISADSNQETKVNFKNIPFNKVDCTYSMTAMRENYNSDIGVEGYHYNTKNPEHEALVKNFNASVSCLNNSSACNMTDKSLDTFLDANDQKHSQRYTSDAYYEGKCTSNTDENSNSYIIYPYGTFTKSYSADENAAYYGTQYFIEYSSFIGTYETYWVFEDVGTKGKYVFDDYFKATEDKPTCSETTSGGYTDDQDNEVDKPLVTCTLEISSSLTRLSGCDPNSVISLMKNSPKKWNNDNVCCQHCTAEDALTYTFKTVDSSNLFPDEGKVKIDGEEKTYAENWLDVIELEDGTSVPSKDAKNQIEARAAQDLTFDSSRISYEFNLNIKDLETIRDYNEINEYSDFKYSCSNKKDGADNIILYYNCLSEFITNYYDGIVNINGTNKLVSHIGVTKSLADARRTDGADPVRHIWPK